MENKDVMLLTVDEMAELLRIGRSSAYELCRQKEFPVVRIGRNIRIPKRALLEWVENQAERSMAFERIT